MGRVQGSVVRLRVSSDLSDLHACRHRSGWDAGRIMGALVQDLAGLLPEIVPVLVAKGRPPGCLFLC
jgi:hypothetical protein